MFTGQRLAYNSNWKRNVERFAIFQISSRVVYAASDPCTIFYQSAYQVFRSTMFSAWLLMVYSSSILILTVKLSRRLLLSHKFCAHQHNQHHQFYLRLRFILSKCRYQIKLLSGITTRNFKFSISYISFPTSFSGSSYCSSVHLGECYYNW